MKKKKIVSIICYALAGISFLALLDGYAPAITTAAIFAVIADKQSR